VIVGATEVATDVDVGMMPIQKHRSSIAPKGAPTHAMEIFDIAIFLDTPQ
jgi:hypothetical protein